ncbi:MAG: acyloxyacyl hydrolase [Bacteroidota bacterium]
MNRLKHISIHIFSFIFLKIFTLKLIKIKFSLSLFFLLSLSQNILSQSDSLSIENKKVEENVGRFRYIDLKGHTGLHKYSGESLENLLGLGYGSFDVKFGWKPSIPEHWSNNYGYASYGIGYYIGFIGNPNVLGTPNAIFGFVNFPVSHPSKRNVFQISPAFGFVFNLKPYDEISNPLNDSFGSKYAFYSNINIGAAYFVSQNMDLLYGIDLTHLSLGRVTTPNYGLNMVGINLGLRYYYNNDQRKLNKNSSNIQLQSRFSRYSGNTKTNLNESLINIYTAIGTVQNEEDKGTSNRYYTFSGVIDYQYKFNTMHAITTGIDLFYDESLVLYYPDKKDRYLVGIHAGYDFMVYKFAFRFQGGAYIGDDKDKEPLYMRVAFQYEFTKWMYAQIGIKSKKGARADWMEWGIGFKPFKW